MSLSTNQSIIRNRFTSNGVSQTLVLPWFPTKLELLNITQFGSAAAATPVITAEWREGMPNNSVLTGTKTNGAATIDIPTMNLTQGVRLINTADQTPGPELTGTSVTNANPAVVTIPNHGLSVGDSVRLYNTTGMLQIAGLDFSVTAVPTVNTFEISTLDASGFAAPATAVNARVTPFTLYYPRFMYITGITQATQAVIQTSFVDVTTDLFSIGQEVRLIIPPEFGMVEANNQRATIVAFSNANGTLTVDLDTTGFTAFSFPTSAIAAAGVTFPQVIPFGNTALNPSTATAQFNQAESQVRLGTNAIGGNTDVMEWTAYRALEI